MLKWIAQLVGYILFLIGPPITMLIFKFDLIKKVEAVPEGYRAQGWVYIVGILVVAGIVGLIKLSVMMTKNVWWKRIGTAFFKSLPIFVFASLLHVISIDIFFYKILFAVWGVGIFLSYIVGPYWIVEGKALKL